MENGNSHSSEIQTPRGPLGNERGIALVMALIITLVVFMLIMSTMYVVNTATKLSGAGKRFATAAEAADGAVEVMKDSINLILYGESTTTLPLDSATTACLQTAVTTNSSCSGVKLNLTGTGLLQTYTATMTVQRLYSMTIPGGRMEFARSAGGSGGTAVFFRISTSVVGPNNTTAETTALYRFVG